jgi:hypothetical protein
MVMLGEPKKFLSNRAWPKGGRKNFDALKNSLRDLKKNLDP